jgi:hypothetical protein
MPIPSVKGLKDSSFGSPLTHFKGKFHSYQTVPSRFKDKNGNSKLNVILNFSDLDMTSIKSKEPYNFPTAQIEIPYSEYNKSRWGVWGNSIIKFLPEGQDFQAAVGSVVTMGITPGHDCGQKDTEDKTKKVMSDCWEIVAVEGMGKKVDPMTRLLELVDGKTVPEFNQIALADSTIRLDPTIITGLINNTLIPALEAKGQIKKDEKGILHKV